MIMGEQLLKDSILDQFVNSHEQSYEEFLNTFTYLSKVFQFGFLWQVDKYLNLEDVDTDEETCTGTFPPFIFTQYYLCICFSSLQLLGDDVQPFSLDEEFDYDNVALTPKFSEAELKALIELSEEKKTDTNIKSKLCC
uniref:Uncharacterized protein n=1 Tax=Malurus cyaneus samueli TaxID=2593467 RepID=A0A8C5UJ81_9PASS